MLKGINGNIQRTNCLDNGGHLFIGPSYLCFNTETIKIFSGVKNNDNLSSDDLNEILKKLYETNFFENISLSILLLKQIY